MSLKQHFFKLLKFFKLVDPDHTLSLTNLAVILVLIKLAFSKDPIQPIDIGALISTLASYQGKKLIGKMANKNNDEPPATNP